MKVLDLSVPTIEGGVVKKYRRLDVHFAHFLEHVKTVSIFLSSENIERIALVLLQLLFQDLLQLVEGSLC